MTRFRSWLFEENVQAALRQAYPPLSVHCRTFSPLVTSYSKRKAGRPFASSTILSFAPFTWTREGRIGVDLQCGHWLTEPRRSEPSTFNAFRPVDLSHEQDSRKYFAGLSRSRS